MTNTGKKKVDWTKTIKKGSLTKELSVRQVENGYLITRRKFGDVNNEWVDETEEFISATNPLVGTPDFGEQIDSITDSLAQSEGMINVK